MKDITAKTTALQKAKAIGVLKVGEQAFELLRQNKLPEGAWRDITKAAASIGLKNAASFIPFNPSVAVEAFQLDFTLLAPGEETADYQAFDTYVLLITGEASAIARAEPGMEAMAGVSTAVLTIYNMLRPVCKTEGEALEVVSLKLLESSGGSAAREKIIRRSYQVAILICSNGVASGNKKDTAGDLAREILHKNNAEVVGYEQLGLDEGLIREKLLEWIAADVPFIITLGGTGPGKTDIVPAIVSGLLDKELPGIVAAMYQYGISRSPKGMLSSLVAGVAADSVLISLPGSTSGLQESLEAILPDVFSFRKMIKGASK